MGKTWCFKFIDWCAQIWTCVEKWGKRSSAGINWGFKGKGAWGSVCVRAHMHACESTCLSAYVCVHAAMCVHVILECLDVKDRLRRRQIGDQWGNRVITLCQEAEWDLSESRPSRHQLLKHTSWHHKANYTVCQSVIYCSEAGCCLTGRQTWVDNCGVYVTFR